jgi:hypothetical protein
MTTSKSDKPNEFWLKLTVTNNVNECMVVSEELGVRVGREKEKKYYNKECW